MSKVATKTTKSTKTQSEATSEFTVSEKLAQLDEQVEWFYGDDFSLDQALEKYQVAADLTKEIERDLSELKNQVEVIADFTKD